MKKAYRYYSGEMVWTLDGVKWFITDHNKNTTKPLKRPINSKIALDITNV
jgi:hypothetical protein